MPGPPDIDPGAIGQKGTAYRGNENRGTTNKAESVVYRTSGPSIARTSETNPEINNLFIALAAVRTKVSPIAFHKFMARNERYLFRLLSPFKYYGSQATPEGTLKDFDRAYFTWQNIIREVSSLPGVQISAPPSEAYFRMKMWEAAGSDPIAAAVVGSGAIISATIGRLFGFEQDSRKAAAAGEGISSLAHAGGSLNAPHPVNEAVRQAKEDYERDTLQRNIPPYAAPPPPVSVVVGGDLSLPSQFDQFARWAQNTMARNPPFTGDYYTVIAHGYPNKIEISWGGKTMTITHRALERLIRQDPAFRGQSILLVSCNTGSWTRGVAQGLAQRLGVEVKAPSNLVFAWADSRPFDIGDPIYRTIGGRREIVGVRPNGSWVTFTPRNSPP